MAQESHVRPERRSRGTGLALRVWPPREPSCVMASDNRKLFSEIEQAQDDLRECIESSRRLVERSDALIRQIKDQPQDSADRAPPWH